MESVQSEDEPGILNETTMTLHRQETGNTAFQTQCGHTHHVAQERLRIVEITSVVEKHEVSKCGRCFEDGGGY